MASKENRLFSEREIVVRVNAVEDRSLTQAGDRAP